MEEYKEKDPIKVIEQTILSKKYASEADLQAIKDKIKAEMDYAVEFAEQSPLPDPSELFTDNYVEPDYPFITD